MLPSTVLHLVSEAKTLEEVEENGGEDREMAHRLE